MIDYLLHTCSLLGESVETPISCVDRLEKRKLLDAESASVLRKLVRLWDIIVHEYSSIDVGGVRRVVEGRGYHRVLEIIHRLAAAWQVRALQTRNVKGSGPVPRRPYSWKCSSPLWAGRGFLLRWGKPDKGGGGG